ncbi:leucine rich repeat protein [Leptospira interrogans serovar Zanoni str. LT2156]|uniref:Leucine rich repeat protein n=2 Tax=Leptospira interrogans TaxID=173 RepID=M6HYF0_LEPIR|nr:leucine rich repeat protein [Leptospira interrogans serovar Zanoni str. LT2156]
MNFRITLNYLQKITISLLFLIHLSCEIQAEEVEPEAYQDLTKALQNPLDVRVLDLSRQELKTLPIEIGQLKNLQRLYLNHNQLITLPEEIGQLQNLQRLYLMDNQLTILSKEIGQLQNLQVLNLSYNQLKTLPKEIEQLKNLQTLYLNNNQLSFQEKEKIRKLLPKCQIKFE